MPRLVQTETWFFGIIHCTIHPNNTINKTMNKKALFFIKRHEPKAFKNNFLAFVLCFLLLFRVHDHRMAVRHYKREHLELKMLEHEPKPNYIVKN